MTIVNGKTFYGLTAVETIKAAQSAAPPATIPPLPPPCVTPYCQAATPRRAVVAAVAPCTTLACEPATLQAGCVQADIGCEQIPELATINPVRSLAVGQATARPSARLHFQKGR